jgi:hypothetical protein
MKEPGQTKKSATEPQINIGPFDGDAPVFIPKRSPMQLMAHPLFKKGCVLPTEPIKELVGSMRRTILLSEQGCCFSATSGFGKSFGLKMAEMELRRQFPGIPIFRHIVDNQQVPSIRAFFKHFLLTVGEDDIRGETYDLRVRLVSRLEEVGRTSPVKMVVILVDEAQGMALQDFCFLKDVGNQLETVDVQLVVIMMGQDPDFEQTIHRLHEKKRLDLVSRFTLRRLRFRGLQSVEDFSSLLQLIDNQCYPASEPCPWPKFFAPRAWDDGFRMINQITPMLDAIARAIPGGLKGGVSARQFFLAVRRFLLDSAEVDHLRVPIPADLWHKCVDYALIEDAAEIAKSENAKKKTRVRL